MKLIQLTQNQVAKVSDEWYEELNKHKWFASYNPRTKSFCAARNSSRKTGNGKQKTIWMHRVVAYTPDGMETDHKDGDTLNNQVDNLRICTHAQNQQNSRKYINNTSGFTGASWSKRDKIWYAYIRINSKRINLGTYATREEAAHAYDQAAKKYHGEFAHLIFP